MPTHPAFTPQTTALVTGAASGIGLAFAKLCHNHGMKVALVDIDGDALSTAQQSILSSASSSSPNAGSGVPLGQVAIGEQGMVKTYQMDVSKLEDWKDLRAKVEMDFGLVGLLMLNAGMMAKSGWEDVEHFHRVGRASFFSPSFLFPPLHPLPFVIQRIAAD